MVVATTLPFHRQTMLEPPIAPASSCIPATVAVIVRPVHARAGHLGIHLPVHNQLLNLPDPAVLDLVPVPCRFNVHPNLFAARFISGAQDRRVGDDRLFVGGGFCIGLPPHWRLLPYIRNGAVRVQRERSVGGEAPRRLRLPPPVREQSVPHAHDEIVQHVSMEQDIQDEADMEVKQQPDGIRENSTNAAIIQP